LVLSDVQITKYGSEKVLISVFDLKQELNQWPTTAGPIWDIHRYVHHQVEQISWCNSKKVL